MKRYIFICHYCTITNGEEAGILIDSKELPEYVECLYHGTQMVLLSTEDRNKT